MALKPRTIVRIAAVAIAIAAVAWQQLGPRFRHPPGGQAASMPVPASTTPSPPLKPALARHWQLGALKLTSCELAHVNSGATTAAWCTDFDVPENPAQPDGRHIGLHVAVIRSDAAKANADLVVMIAGGPGEASTADFADTSMYKGLLKHHHVLLVDQRGTGRSNPLSCDKTTEALRAQGDGNGEPASAEKTHKAVAACLAEVQTRADPRYYTTTLAIEDLEKIRVTAGSPRLNLIGVSYGTRVAQQYLAHHPEAIRSVVLDSPVPDPLILGEDFAANLDAALREDFADCVAAPACRKAYGDPMVTLHKLRESLRANPHEVSFRDPRTFETVKRRVTPEALAVVVRMFAYSPLTAALLPLSIDAASRDDFGPLLGQERLLEADLGTDMNGGMGMSVICSEDADLIRDRPEDADTVLGHMLTQGLKAQCEVWPHGTRPADFHEPLKSSTPVLILSGSRDPVTPPRYGQEILQGLSNVRHLVLKGQGHAVLTTGCAPKIIEQFVDDADPKKLDATCLDRLGPTPAFVDFNGAAP